MADTVDSKILFAGTKKYVQHITNESDGTGEAGVTKLDISTLVGPAGVAPSSVSIMSINYAVSGMNYVVLEWNATVNDEIAVLHGQGFIDWSNVGGNADPKSSGSTGDIVLTTDGAVNGSMYDITIEYKLKA